MLVAYMKVLGM